MIRFASLLALLLVACSSRTTGGADGGEADPMPSDDLMVPSFTDGGAPAPDAGPLAPDAGPGIDAGPGCVPTCGAAECGDDGCGGVCGTCASNEGCTAGECVEVCPRRSHPVGGTCECDAGYVPGTDCVCRPDTNGDGCPTGASPAGGGSCACDEGWMEAGCGCAPITCASDETLWCGACVPDPDGDDCPENASPDDATCACDDGFRLAADGCSCESVGPSFTDPAFEPTSCAGPAMTHASAMSRWSAGDGLLDSYQMVFRRRPCDASGCGAWEEVPLSDIPWRTRASGVLRLVQRSGVMNLDVRYGLCTHHHYLDGSEYNVGAACTGVGATLTCGGYRYPGICLGPSSSADYYEWMGDRLYFSGTLTDSCVRLVADVSSSTHEGQVGIFATF